MAIVRAISIRQPWAELVLRGIKRREFRSIPTRIRERVYVYAGLRPGGGPMFWKQVGKAPGELPTGVVVGSVEIQGCRWNGRKGRYEYILVNPRRFRRPRRVDNQPGPVFWRPQFR